MKLGKKSFKLFSNAKLTLSHVKGIQNKLFVQKTSGTLLRQTAEKYPNKYALHSYYQNKSLTYSQIYQKAHQLASSLIQLGFKPQQRLAIYSPNTYSWFIVQFAAALSGLILVNINPAYQKSQLLYALNKVQCKGLITYPKFKHSNYIQMINDLIPQLKKLKTGNQLNCQTFPHLKYIFRMDNQKSSGIINLSDIYTKKKSQLPTIDPYSPVNIQFTSGTTGFPKACLLTHNNIVNNGISVAQSLRYNQNDIACIPVPLYHCAGMVLGNMASISRGATSVYVSEGFQPIKLMESISKYKCTSIIAVPTIFIQCLRQYEKNKEKYNIQNLRKASIGGSMCPQILIRRLIETMNLSQLVTNYGMTQTSPISFQTDISDTPDKKSLTVGKICAGLQGKIVDQNLNPVPINTPGQILVKGYSVMKQYWQDEQSTKKSIIDGWMRTGDLGIINQQGYLSIVGRNKDMIIRGGENIFPKQIQNFLMKLPGVKQAIVVGVPDQKFGEECFALVKLLDGHSLTKREVYERCHKVISHYKIPKYLRFVESYPTTLSGKVQKFKIKESLQQQSKKDKQFWKNNLLRGGHE